MLTAVQSPKFVCETGIRLYRPVSYISHGISERDFSDNKECETDVCVHPVHDIKTVQNLQFWLFIIAHFNFNVIILSFVVISFMYFIILRF